MKPPPFAYCDPRTVPEALDLLRQHGADAKLLAGGQSLVPALNMRLSRPRVIIDLNRVAELAYIREEGGELAIGAMARHAQVEGSPLVAARQPLLAEAVRHIGHFQIRNRGTAGGSLAHADPAAEWPAALACLDGRLRIAGPGGIREVGWEEFFLGYFTTCLQPDEMLVEVRVPALPAGAGHAFLEVARRHGDFALVGVACTLALGPDGTVAAVRIALTGVGPAPVRARGAEAALVGQRPGPGAFREAGHLAASATEPESDIHASAAYRKHLAAVLTERALAAALRRAEGGGAA